MKRLTLAIVLAGVACIIAGCASGQGYVAPAFTNASVGTIAIADVTGAIDSENARNQIADVVGSELRNHGYNVVSRVQTMNAARGANIEGRPATNEDYSALGRGVGADALLFVDVSEWNSRTVQMNARLVEAGTGATLWNGTGKGDTQKVWATVGGAAAGAVVGGLIGGGGGRSVAGAVIGGAAGGAGGYFLSPNEEKIARKIAAEMFKDFPMRGYTR